MPRSILTKTLCAIAVLGGLTLAQQNSGRSDDPGNGPAIVYVGQPLDGLSEILAVRKVRNSEGGFAFAKGDPDQSNLLFTLDEDHTWVCAFFSKSRMRITGLTMVFFPGRTAHDKASESWIPATEILLYADRSYAVHFAVPLTSEQLRDAEANRPPSIYPPVR